MHAAKNIFTVAMSVIGMMCYANAVAGPYADDLSKCLVRSTTVEDKQVMVKWMFATVALHPEVRSIASISPEQREQINKNYASLYEKLLTVSCRSEILKALQFEEPANLRTSFHGVGQAAGRELFNDPAVSAGLVATFKYFDESKMRELFSTDK